jgi:hypothetical protein
MNDETPSDSTIRLTALDKAISAGMYLDGVTSDIDRLLAAAKKIEAYLKGTNNE